MSLNSVFQKSVRHNNLWPTGSELWTPCLCGWVVQTNDVVRACVCVYEWERGWKDLEFYFMLKWQIFILNFWLHHFLPKFLEKIKIQAGLQEVLPRNHFGDLKVRIVFSSFKIVSLRWRANLGNSSSINPSQHPTKTPQNKLSTGETPPWVSNVVATLLCTFCSSHS